MNKFNENNFGLISNCDLLVIPSQKYESFGYTAIEAMSLKKPVVSTNCGGLREVIENNITGYVINKNNPKIFAKKNFGFTKELKLKKEKWAINHFIDTRNILHTTK